MASNEKTLRDILNRLGRLEARVAKLESQREPLSKPMTAAEVQSFGGLSGGVNLILKEGFLNTPKSVDDIQKELERRGYYHSFEAIATLLRRDFMKRRQILTSVEKDGKWYYVNKK